MVLYIFIFLLLLALTYLLTAPFYLEINTTQNIYRARFHRWAWARVYFTDESLFMEIRLFWWRKITDLLVRKPKPSSKATQKRATKNKAFSLWKIRAIAKSFKINQCHASIDTGDEALNGMLFPLAYGVGRWLKQDVAVNFLGHNALIFEAENNFFRIIMAYARS